MKRLLRQTGIFLVLLLLLTIVRYPYADIVRSRVENLIEQAQSRGIEISLERLRLGFPPHIEFSATEILFPRPALPPLFPSPGRIELTIDSLTFHPQLLGLCWGRLRGQLDSTLYSGFSEARFDRSVFGGSTQVELSGRELRLGDHPTFQTVGIGGIASYNADIVLGPDSPSGRMRIETAKGEFQLKNGFYGGGHRIQGIIPIPAFETLELVVRGTHDGDQVTINALELFSSQGSVVAQGTVRPAPQFSASEFNFSGKIILSSDGRRTLGPYLAAAAGASLESPAREWVITVKKAANQPQPQVQFSPG